MLNVNIRTERKTVHLWKTLSRTERQVADGESQPIAAGGTQ
jgi:hypothetical protein